MALTLQGCRRSADMGTNAVIAAAKLAAESFADVPVILREHGVSYITVYWITS